MTAAPTDQTHALIALARQVAVKAHAPYSCYGVGAIVLTGSGETVAGCNLENASYGLTLCAETVALAQTNVLGLLRDVREIVVVGGALDNGVIKGSELVTPCGRCRQLINEAAQLSKHDILVHCAAAEGDEVRTLPISALLPHAFGPHNLGIE